MTRLTWGCLMCGGTKVASPCTCKSRKRAPAQLTAIQARWLSLVLECCTSTQERAADELIRQAIFAKLGEMQRRKP